MQAPAAGKRDLWDDASLELKRRNYRRLENLNAPHFLEMATAPAHFEPTVMHF